MLGLSGGGTSGNGRAVRLTNHSQVICSPGGDPVRHGLSRLVRCASVRGYTLPLNVRGTGGREVCI